MMKRTLAAHPERAALLKDFEKAFLSSTGKSLRGTPHEVIRALDGLLMKPRRIASILKVKPELVRFWLSGRQPIRPRYLPPLYAVLQLSIDVVKEHVSRAERKELLWGQVSFPAEVLSLFRARIRDAEAVLSRAEDAVKEAVQP